MTTQEAATEARAYFTTTQRGDETIVTLKDDRPEWVQDMVYAAHAGMLPDDWRYACIRDAVDWIAEDCGEDAGEFADSAVDVYTGARMEWLSSHGSRQGYVDDAAYEFGDSVYADGVVGAIGMGQYMEASEVFGLVLSALEDHAEEDEDE